MSSSLQTTTNQDSINPVDRLSLLKKNLDFNPENLKIQSNAKNVSTLASLSQKDTTMENFNFETSLNIMLSDLRISTTEQDFSSLRVSNRVGDQIPTSLETSLNSKQSEVKQEVTINQKVEQLDYKPNTIRTSHGNGVGIVKLPDNYHDDSLGAKISRGRNAKSKMKSKSKRGKQVVSNLKPYELYLLSLMNKKI
jgi:hypothetical protein